MEKTISMNEAIPATFGSFMRVKREEQGMSLRSLARKLEVTATYISDIEIGNRPAPRSRLQDISDILCLDKNDESIFFDLAAITCCNLYEDINPYISQNKTVRIALRRARDMGLPDSWWQEVITQINSFDKP